MHLSPSSAAVKNSIENDVGAALSRDVNIFLLKGKKKSDMVRSEIQIGKLSFSLFLFVCI
jgi:hypothetical protein